MGFPISSVYSWWSLSRRNILPATQVFGIRSYFPGRGAYWILVLRGYGLQLIPRLVTSDLRTMRGEIWIDLELFDTMQYYRSSFAYVFAEDLTHFG